MPPKVKSKSTMDVRTDRYHVWHRRLRTSRYMGHGHPLDTPAYGDSWYAKLSHQVGVNNAARPALPQSKRLTRKQEEARDAKTMCSDRPISLCGSWETRTHTPRSHVRRRARRSTSARRREWVLLAI